MRVTNLGDSSVDLTARIVDAVGVEVAVIAQESLTLNPSSSVDSATQDTKATCARLASTSTVEQVTLLVANALTSS